MRLKKYNPAITESIVPIFYYWLAGGQNTWKETNINWKEYLKGSRSVSKALNILQKL